MRIEKDAWLEATPPCAVCGGRGIEPRAQLHLPFGVSVWLCAAHRSEEFQRRRDGHELCSALAETWEACGAMSAVRQRALDAHRARLAAPPPVRGSRRPGSYTWQALREEAEARWASGEPVGPVIDELRGRHLDGMAVVPSQATMRRWFREGRWFDPAHAGAAAAQAAAAHAAAAA
ncbi:MAG TPA: hypothetical protein VL422_04985 [Miltoncostaea sp.]|nr:hypothetical protein [Miltoncostaea sp.]